MSKDNRAKRIVADELAQVAAEGVNRALQAREMSADEVQQVSGGILLNPEWLGQFDWNKYGHKASMVSKLKAQIENMQVHEAYKDFNPSDVHGGIVVGGGGGPVGRR